MSARHSMSATASDVCTDCGRVLTTDDLFRCGRALDGEWVEIRLCIDCLYAVNPYMQRRLIEAVTDAPLWGRD